jgi:formate transporter
VPPADSGHEADTTAFRARTLLPVTLGNLIGGTVLVGLAYWSVSRRPGAAPHRC